MRELRHLVLAVAAAAMGLPSAWAGDIRSAAQRAGSGEALALVNGKPVKQEYADAIFRERASTGQALDDAAKQAIVQRLVTNELFVQEALKRSLDRRPDDTVRIEMLRRDVLANAFVQTYLSEHPISDSALAEEYNRLKLGLQGQKEYAARHILVADEAQARDLIAQLVKGADFGALARESSIDTGGAKERGGSLGWINRDNTESALLAAASGMTKGAYTKQPVKTRFGWHVLQIEDVRDVQILPLEAAKELVRVQLQKRQVEALEQELHGQARVVLKGQP